MAMYLKVRQEREAFAQTYFQCRIQNGEDYDLGAKKYAQTMGDVLYRLNPNGTTAPVAITTAIAVEYRPFAQCLLEDSNNPLRDSLKQKEKWLRNPDQLYDMVEHSNQLPTFVHAMNIYRTNCQARNLMTPIFKGSGLITLMDFAVRYTLDKDRVMSMEMVDTIRIWQGIHDVDEDDAIFYGDTYANAAPTLMNMMENDFDPDIAHRVFCRYTV